MDKPFGLPSFEKDTDFLCEFFSKALKNEKYPLYDYSYRDDSFKELLARCKELEQVAFNSIDLLEEKEGLNNKR